MIRKLLFSVAVIAGLLFGYHTPAAQADPPPGWFYLAQYDGIDITHSGCTVEFMYGQFGANAFSMATVRSGSCGGGTGVQTYGWGAQTQLCQFITDPAVAGCDVINGGATTQATVTASLIGGRLHLDPSVGSSIDLYFCDCP